MPSQLLTLMPHDAASCPSMHGHSSHAEMPQDTKHDSASTSVHLLGMHVNGYGNAAAMLMMQDGYIELRAYG